MSDQPPRAYEEFVGRYPDLGAAWDLIRKAGRESGPLDERAALLVKLGISFGALKQGAVHSAVRKALAGGVRPEEIEQSIALAASTIGLPSSVAIHTWVKDLLSDG